MTSSVEAVRAEALFASPLQSSEQPAADEVRGAVAATLRRFGIGGCVVRVAEEFGAYPETAVARMRWALAMVRTVYPPAATGSASHRPQPPASRSLALAG
jgi:hypothetical protein